MADLGERVAVNEQKIKSLEKRMAKVEEKDKILNELISSTKETAVNVSKLVEVMQEEKQIRKENEKRLSRLEMLPAEDARKLKFEIVKYVVCSILGALLGAILALIIK